MGIRKVPSGPRNLSSMIPVDIRILGGGKEKRVKYMLSLEL